SHAVCGRSPCHDRASGVRRARPCDGHWPLRGAPMSRFSRRGFLAGGVTAAGVAVAAGAAGMARRVGLIPPDALGPYGPGETLTYAAHRLVGRHSMAREFPRHMIS